GLENGEAGLTQQSLILTGRDKEVETDRAADGELLVGYDAGDYHGVGEERPSAGPQDPIPVPQSRKPLADMTHRVVGDDGIEARLRERERLVGIQHLEAGALA